jgi:hypothetical protein
MRENDSVAVALDRQPREAVGNGLCESGMRRWLDGMDADIGVAMHELMEMEMEMEMDIHDLCQNTQYSRYHLVHCKTLTQHEI